MAISYGYIRNGVGSVGRFILWFWLAGYIITLVPYPTKISPDPSAMVISMFVIKLLWTIGFGMYLPLVGFLLAYYSGDILRKLLGLLNSEYVHNHHNHTWLFGVGVYGVSSWVESHSSTVVLVCISLLLCAIISTIMSELDVDTSGFTEGVLIAYMGIFGGNHHSKFKVGAVIFFALYAKASESILKRLLVHWKWVYLQDNSDASHIEEFRTWPTSHPYPRRVHTE